MNGTVVIFTKWLGTVTHISAFVFRVCHWHKIEMGSYRTWLTTWQTAFFHMLLFTIRRSSFLSDFFLRLRTYFSILFLFLPFPLGFCHERVFLLFEIEDANICVSFCSMFSRSLISFRDFGFIKLYLTSYLNTRMKVNAITRSTLYIFIRNKIHR